MKKNLLYVLSAALIGSFVWSSQAFALVYGGGSYGACTYQTGCPATPTPTPSSSPSPSPSASPSPSSSPSAVVIPVNIQPGATIGGSTSEIIVGPFTDPSLAPGPTTSVSVTLRGDVIGDSTQANPDGTYHFIWNPSLFTPGSAELNISITDSTGKVTTRIIPIYIARKVAAPAPVVTNSDPIVAIIPANIKKVIHSVPPPVARSFPYLLFALIGIAILILIWRTRRELAQIRVITAAVTKQRLLSEEKDNFIQLSTHYLRTPVTIISGGIDLIVGLKGDPTLPPKLRPFVESLKTKIDKILTDISNDNRLADIHAADAVKVRLTTFGSPFLYLPVILIGALAMLSNYLFSAVNHLDISFIDYITQLLVYGLIVFVLYNVLRNSQTERERRLNSEALIEYEQALDRARNTFIRKVSAEIGADVTGLNAALTGDPANVAIKNIRSGIDRFSEMLRKFDTLASLEKQHGASSYSPVDLKAILRDIVSGQQPVITKKQVLVDLPYVPVAAATDPKLAQTVLTSVVDNAVKFAPAKGHVEISLSKIKRMVSVVVHDNGSGIRAEELPHLFKPFSRAEANSLVFNYEGLGFSLYLDKVIMDYLDGDIAADSTPGSGTTITITLPA